MERYRSLGSLKSFLWYAPYLSRASILFFSILNPLRWHSQGSYSGWWLDGPQHPLFADVTGDLLHPYLLYVSHNILGTWHWTVGILNKPHPCLYGASIQYFFCPHNLMKWVLSLMSFSRWESRSTEILSKLPRVSQNDTGEDSCRNIIYLQSRRGCFLPSCRKDWTILTQGAHLPTVCLLDSLQIWPLDFTWINCCCQFLCVCGFSGHFN